MSKSAIFAIMSDDEQAELIMLGNAISTTAWAVGDRTLEQCKRLDITKRLAMARQLNWSRGEINALMQSGYMDVYLAVGELVGKSARTIREWARCAETFQHGQREQYGVLPFAHFAFAASHPGHEDHILSIAMRQMDYNGGKPPSVEWLEVNFRCVSMDNAAPVERAQEIEEETGPMVGRVYYDTVLNVPDIKPDEYVLFGQLRRVFTVLEAIVAMMQDGEPKRIILQSLAEMKRAVGQKCIDN